MSPAAPEDTTSRPPTEPPACPFCDIAEGRSPASLVFDDDRVVAFLDRRPINPGHVLVVPRVHAPSFYELPETSSSP